MSRASRRRRQRGKPFPWPVLMFAGVLLIGVAIVLTINPFGPRDADDGSERGSSRISVDPEKIDYGYVKFGNEESFTIKVTNTGTGVLRFGEQPYIEVLEGC